MGKLLLDNKALEEIQSKGKQEEFYDEGFHLGGSFGVRVNPSGKKVFFLIYSINGKRRRMTLGTYPLLSVEEAKERAAEILKKVAEGRDPASEEGAVDTFSEFSELFLERHVKKYTKPSTAKEYQRILSKELLPFWENRLLRDIKRRDIITLLDNIAVQRGSSVMAERTRMLISKMFVFALKRGLVEKNPASEIEKQAEEPSSFQVLSFDEIRLLWQALLEETLIISSIFKLLLLSGQKPSDVMGLRWECIKLDRWEREEDLPDIHLTPQLLQILKTLYDNKSFESDFVFPSRQGGPVTHIRRAAGRISKRMGMAWSPLDIRRTVEVRMFELGVSSHVIDALVGRKTAMARHQKRFGQINYEEETKRALLLWGQKISALASPPPSPKSEKVVSLFR